MNQINGDIAIIGAGIVGVATAYYLKKLSPDTSIVLIDSDPPMSLTSAQSGENYRNWWPHPVMTAFTDRSIDLMEELASATRNAVNMRRRGYVLATRADDAEELMSELDYGYSQLDQHVIRVHEGSCAETYQRPINANWEDAPSGVDVLNNTELIRQNFPSYARDIKTVIHIRRAGDISAQQMGQWMLDQYKDAGGQRVQADINSIDVAGDFKLHASDQRRKIVAERVINAAGPFINHIATMLGTRLPVSNTLQQKIAFEDRANVIPRDMPFSIDLDQQHIDWSVEEHQLLKEDPDHRWLTEAMPGSIHCRPDGGDHGNWIKLGWAFNDTPSQATRNPELLSSFPEIVLRGTSRLNPGLKRYYDRLPRALRHYGGYYTLTDENWPLIGAMEVPGAYVVGAMSGFGTMAACAAGELCARVVLDYEIPDYGDALSLQRYHDEVLMNELAALSQRGIL